MTEVMVSQRSQEWFELRRGLQLTASRFGDALGVGRGRPFDFFQSLISEDACYQDKKEDECTAHGIRVEPVIDEAYQLLTGNTTQSSGLWLPKEGSILHGLCGATPDGKIVSSSDPNKLIGLVEYKAPVYQMYDCSKVPHGIPRNYMAQVQGQMAISGAPWCDFMAVCVKTKQLSLQRVFAKPVYWQFIAKKLQQFCLIFRDAKQRQKKKQQFLYLPGVQRLKVEPMARQPFPGEGSITVKNLIQRNSKGQYKSLSSTWLDFDFLMGLEPSNNPILEDYDYECRLRDIDREIRQGQSSSSGNDIR
ncbi:uncharacterized protein LOC117294006 [Asterias rubens]|uniref:uncharacterized protein LOC117294006 n=1 Tax=Asterias rubens TaxID=7604 RepID=UPI0014553314|nr:uncharacterized protein LOC117294006 [Asterias rubens]